MDRAGPIVRAEDGERFLGGVNVAGHVAASGTAGIGAKASMDPFLALVPRALVSALGLTGMGGLAQDTTQDTPKTRPKHAQNTPKARPRPAGQCGAPAYPPRTSRKCCGD